MNGDVLGDRIGGAVEVYLAVVGLEGKDHRLGRRVEGVHHGQPVPHGLLFFLRGREKHLKFTNLILNKAVLTQVKKTSMEHPK